MSEERTVCGLCPGEARAVCEYDRGLPGKARSHEGGRQCCRQLGLWRAFCLLLFAKSITKPQPRELAGEPKNGQRRDPASADRREAFAGDRELPMRKRKERKRHDRLRSEAEHPEGGTALFYALKTNNSIKKCCDGLAGLLPTDDDEYRFSVSDVRNSPLFIFKL